MELGRSVDEILRNYWGSMSRPRPPFESLRFGDGSQRVDLLMFRPQSYVSDTDILGSLEVRGTDLRVVCRSPVAGVTGVHIHSDHPSRLWYGKRREVC